MRQSVAEARIISKWWYTARCMGGLPRTDGIAHIVAVNMGYGHERPAHALRSLAGDAGIWIANDYDGIPAEDKQLWETSRVWYERISRFRVVPIVGPLAFGIMDDLQRISPFYPRRDLSRPSLQLLELYSLLRKRNWCRHLVETLAKSQGVSNTPLPLICTFFTPAFAAEEFGYPGDIFVVVTDADMSRAWAPLAPKRSRLKYFAPTGRVAERLKLYGVREENIFYTGFPLPMEAVGGPDATIVKEDLGRRLCTLDPRGVFVSRAMHLIDVELGRGFCERARQRSARTPLSVSFAVGGAGAQREIAVAALKSLRHDILRGRLRYTLVAGTRPEVAEYFRKAVMDAGLASALRKGDVRVLAAPNRPAYFSLFTKTMRETDILWTKPSELSFYAGLGIPIIMAPPVGSQEDFNRNWLQQIGGGVDQLDPRYANEWLFDWVDAGALARMAWNGYVEAPTHGAYRIQDILLGRPNTMHELPLVV